MAVRGGLRRNVPRALLYILWNVLRNVVPNCATRVAV